MAEHRNDSGELSRVMRELLSSVHESRTLRDVLNRILEEALPLVRAKRGDFAMRGAGSKLTIEAVRGETSNSLDLGQECPRKSFMGYVYYKRKQRTPYIVGNVNPLRRKGRYHESSHETASEAAVVIEFRGRRIGVLNVEAFRKDAFDGAASAQLRQLADYAAIAVQVFVEESRLRQLVASVLTKSDGGTTQDDLQRILREILDAVHELFGFTDGLIYLADTEERRLQVCGWRRQAPPKNGFGYNFGEKSLAWTVYDTGKARFCKDVRDPRINKKGVAEFRITGSLVGVPLMFGSKAVGVMVCWSNRRPHPAEWHLSHLEPVATLCGWKIAVWEAERRRLKLQRTMTKQMELFESLVENLPVRVFRKDRKSRFSYANKWFVEHLGETSDSKVISKDDFKFYEAELAERYQREDKVVMKTRGVVPINEPNEIKNSGDPREVQGFKSALIDKDTDRVIGVQGMFWDVTKHTRLQEQRSSLLHLMEMMLRIALSGKEVDSYVLVKEHLDQLANLLNEAPPPLPPAPPPALAPPTPDVGYDPHDYVILWAVDQHAVGEGKMFEKQEALTTYIRQRIKPDGTFVAGDPDKPVRLTKRSESQLFNRIKGLVRSKPPRLLKSDDGFYLTDHGRAYLKRWQKE